jgi:hypothetical protein
MSTDELKAVSTTKLLVIDTKTGVAKSFEGNFECGEAHLPDEFNAKSMKAELNEFRLSADGARVRAQALKDKQAETGKRIAELSAEYGFWFKKLGMEVEPDTFGL